jgi:hypothetical protein
LGLLPPSVPRLVSCFFPCACKGGRWAEWAPCSLASALTPPDFDGVRA